MSKQLNLFKIALLSGIKTGIFSISPLVMNFTIEPEAADLNDFIDTCLLNTEEHNTLGLVLTHMFFDKH